MSPRNEYFCTTPKNGSAQECGSKGKPHGNISAQKSNISARKSYISDFTDALNVHQMDVFPQMPVSTGKLVFRRATWQHWSTRPDQR